jgi:hypothetical protein
MDDRDRMNLILDELSRVQKVNKDLEVYIGMLENLLGVVHLDRLGG